MLLHLKVSQALCRLQRFVRRLGGSYLDRIA